MNKEIEIKVPKEWSAVSLKDYLALRKDMETYKDEPEAVVACMFHHLCHFPVDYLKGLDVETYSAIKDDLLGFLGKTEHPLERFITIDGIEYGFEPDLSKIAYGAYVDISKYDNIGIDDKWGDIMSILYRPVISKNKTLYSIKAYDGVIDGDKFLNVNMDVHFGTLFFLISLLKDLLSCTLSSLKMEELPINIKSILDANGKAIAHLSNSQVII